MADTLKKICEDYGLTPEGVRYALKQYQRVITEITDGFFSRLTYDADTIINKAYERYEQAFEEDHGWVSVKERETEDTGICRVFQCK